MDRPPCGGYNTCVQLYPLKFRPIYKRRIWGGQKLRTVFGKDIPVSEKIGESWELADLPHDKSVVTNGPLAGEAIDSLIKKYPAEIIANKDFSDVFPLLIKFLDAEDILSVQVHPDEKTCRKMGKGEPKTECWYIVSAEKDAVIYKGLKKGVTRDKFAKALAKGEVEDLLIKVPVKAGECHFLPAGTVHAIGPGLLIAEIQTPSDTTYRVFDWNRVEENGKPRPLHIEEAMESIHFDPSGDNLTVTTACRLADCKYFKVDKVRQMPDCRLPFSAGGMKVLIILSGSGEAAGAAADFKAGDTVLVPAGYEGAIQFYSETQYLTVMV